MRRTRVITVLSASSLLWTIGMGVSRADTGDLCAPRADAVTCARYSALVGRLIDAVSPGAVSRIGARLAIGYRVDDGSVVRCVLGTTCDLWPVVVRASAPLTNPAACPLPDASLCGLARAAVAPVDAAAAAAVLERVVAGASVATPGDAVNALARTAVQAFAGLTRNVNGEQIANTVVGVVYLALNLVPALPPEAAPPRETFSPVVEPIESPEGSVPLLDDAEALSGVGVSSATKDVQHCRAHYVIYAGLITESDQNTFTKFHLVAFEGITRLEWADRNELHTRCAKPFIVYDGTLFETAHSNASSPLYSQTKSSDPVASDGTLHLGDVNVIETEVDWRLDKVTLDYAFPVEFVINYWSPPAGDYESAGTMHLRSNFYYSFPDARDKYSKYVSVKCQQGGWSDLSCDYSTR